MNLEHKANGTAHDNAVSVTTNQEINKMAEEKKDAVTKEGTQPKETMPVERGVIEKPVADEQPKDVAKASVKKEDAPIANQENLVLEEESTNTPENTPKAEESAPLPDKVAPPANQLAETQVSEPVNSRTSHSDSEAEAEPALDTEDGTAAETDPAEESVSDKEQEEDPLAQEDFINYSKEQFVAVVKMLAKHNNPLYAERYLKIIEPLFDKLKNNELAKAKEAYIAENGHDEGFSFKPDELVNRFYANARLIHDKKHAYVKEREAQKQLNLKKAEETLEKLRLFVDSEESNASFNKFKEIQQEWKAIGDVPGQHAKTLWANYNALVNRFYDQRSIYFELKELDRKKNYEAKVKLCERAEALDELDNIKQAISTLNDLHHEYKHLGPVPKELQEDLWARFKAASDKVYQKRKAFVSELKVTLLENLKLKEALVAEIAPFVEFTSDRIKAWNAKTKELLELQKRWEAIGGLPRDKSKEVNKRFWSAFKSFFHHKGEFFKQLDAERKTNYEAKLALVKKAEELKEHTDWAKTANAFIALQQEWKTIGPVPEKFRNEVYEKFKAACDFFFENKRANSKDTERSYRDNLKQKKAIIAQLNEWATAADNHIDDFKAKAKEFAEIGFVPRKDIGSIKEKYSEAVAAFVEALSADEETKNRLRLEVEMGDLLNGQSSEKALYGKEQSLRRQVQQLENDVALWRNNLEFFAHSKNADSLRTDVNQKIAKAEAKISLLKGQLKMLRSV